MSLFTPQERQSYAQRGLVLPLLLFLGVASGYAGLEVALLDRKSVV